MLIALIIVAVLAVGFAVLALWLLELGSVGLAERKAADVLAEPFGHRVSIRVRSAPFLVQVVRGVYREVVIGGGGLRLGELTGASLNARLANIHLPLRKLLRRRVDELSCERIDGRLLLPLGEIARVARIPGLELRLADGGLVASAALPIPGFTQLARVSGEAVLSIRPDSSVWLRIRNVSVAGIALPNLVLNQLLPSLDVRIPLPDLPYGLRLQALQPTPDGLLVTGFADAVTFRAIPEPAGGPTVQDGDPVR